MINTFWIEFEEFESKSGVYCNREYKFKNEIHKSNWLVGIPSMFKNTWHWFRIEIVGSR
jgi:hypothetical protein